MMLLRKPFNNDTRHADFHTVEARPWRMSWRCSKAGRRITCSSKVRSAATCTAPTGCLTDDACPVNNDIQGLMDSVNDGTTSAFMWEWFTTKPFVDAGEARFVR